MADLLGQNIGTNYKGILNLNTLNGNLTSTLQAITDGGGNASILQLSTGEVGITRTIALSAGSSNVRLINQTYTINNSGAQTGTLSGIFLNATETNLNGMTHYLIELQRAGSNRFRIKGDGEWRGDGTNAVLTYNQYFTINSGGSFQLGCYLSGAAFSTNGPITANVTGSTNASAIIQADSTTRGFLPPRMTTTQKTDIVNPAKGLIVYDTTTDKLCVNNGSWVDLH